MPATPGSAPNLATVKARQQHTWSVGDFHAVGVRTVLVSERLCEAADLLPGQRVLDVAGGSGNTALAAARRYGQVTCTDYVPALLERARIRAEADGLPMTIQEADAEQLPFPDAAFDVVLSTFGVMFAPDQEQAARELLRVCRSGGLIGLANWTPDGFLGELFELTARHVPPPSGVASAFRWGTEIGLRELLGDGVREWQITPQQHLFRFQSAAHYLDTYRTFYGPTQQAFAALDAAGQASLASDLTALVERHNRAGTAAAVIPGDYLEVVAVRS